MHTFVGGVDSGDHSIAVLVGERLAHDAPIEAAQVVVEELSRDPVQVAERLNAEWPPFERVIFVSAIARARPPGTVEAYRWDGEILTGDSRDLFAGDVQLEQTLVTARELGGLPEETIIVEVEPDGDNVSSAELSPAASTAVERARTLVRRLATNRRAAASLPRAALGGPPASRRHLAD